MPRCLLEASSCSSGCLCCTGTVEVPAGTPQTVLSTPAPEADPIQLLILDMKVGELMQKVPGLQGPAARHLLKVPCLSCLTCCSEPCGKAAAQPSQCLVHCAHSGPTGQLLLEILGDAGPLQDGAASVHGGMPSLHSRLWLCIWPPC